MQLGFMLPKKTHINVVPCETIAEEVSFGRSHHRFSPASVKVETPSPL